MKNGADGCGFRQLNEEQLGKLVSQVNEIHSTVSDVHNNTDLYLKMIAEALNSIKNEFVNAIVGKEQIPQEMVADMLKGQRQTFLLVIRTICWSFTAITAVLIGLKAIFPQFL